MESAVLFLTHRTDPATLEAFHGLERDCEGQLDTFLVLDESNRSFDRVPGCSDVFRFSAADVWRFQPPHLEQGEGRSLVPGNLDLVVLYFHDRVSGYDRYWLVEYDVRFSGDWMTLFGAFRDSPADLVGGRIFRRVRALRWRWWATFEPARRISWFGQLKSFLPCYRISRRALRVLRSAYREGWRGHYEATVPTALRTHGLELEDMGGKGPWVRDGNEGRFYLTRRMWGVSEDTFGVRPVRSRPGSRPDTLWHPVKPELSPRTAEDAQNRE